MGCNDRGNAQLVQPESYCSCENRGYPCLTTSFGWRKQLPAGCGFSRSELYARALAEFLKQQDGSRITERLNEIYSQHAATVDPGLHRAQLKSLEKETW